MKYLLSTIFILIGYLPAAHASSNSVNSFHLTNVNIIDVLQQKILTDQTITVINGNIETIVDNDNFVNQPRFNVINGNNGYVTPGLIDMHVHIYEQAAYIFLLSHGVTHVRIMNGIPANLIWRDQINAGSLVGSSSTVSSPILSSYENTYLHHSVKSKTEAELAVLQYHEAGYDLIKAYGYLTEDALRAIISTAKAIGMPVAKHGPYSSGKMPLSMLASLQSFEHVEDIFQGPLNYQFEPQRLPSIINELKKTNVPLTPTLNIFAHLTRLSVEKNEYFNAIEQDYSPRIIALEEQNNQIKRWLNATADLARHNQKTLAFLKLITQQLHQQQIPLLVGSDAGVLMSPHGISTHHEMALLLQSGLSPFEVLAAATLNPAKVLGLSNKLGQIKPHYQADFIYTTANPIERLGELKNPAAVIKNGHWYSKEKLSFLRQQAKESRSIWQELKVLFQAF